ncbi:hypothetical protein AKJ40_02085 [candidate division MSBL1 archaeon SCGC-AAA259M10]|uniref:Uncharacterized protein n=2 Tax=candidate division MSBL1 TaxID=215777 RepID=A0A133U353_9EURY|nr:hypothetical protein AKJ62_04800 [candidate division MSBL1 archaeon SCGC-AAA259D14]KXA99967.1 hypothetical protein AKJ40_02085 [candidate division MSBL1 archaeon SCGC-AAA259M10]
MKYEEKLKRAEEFGEIVREEELLTRLKRADDHQYFHPLRLPQLRKGQRETGLRENPVRNLRGGVR